VDPYWDSDILVAGAYKARLLKFTVKAPLIAPPALLAPGALWRYRVGKNANRQE